MRLIDAYALINDIEELITEHEEMRRDSKAHPENYPEDYKTRVLNLIAGLITAKVEVYNAPTIDAEPIVRCKDCEYWTKQSDSLQGRCALSGSYPTGAWYCANAERREPKDDNAEGR